MRRPRSKLQVSTFPFLAVLLCAMGSLLLLLFIMDRRAKIAARHKVAELLTKRKERTKAEEEARQADWEKAKAALHDSLLHQGEQLRLTSKTVENELGNAAKKLEIVQSRHLSVEEKIKAESDRIASLHLEILAHQEGVRKSVQKENATKAELLAAAKELAELEAAFRQLKALRKSIKHTYSLVPYRGKLGDTRAPIYVECKREGVLFHPDRTLIESSRLTSTALREEIDRKQAPIAIQQEAGDKIQANGARNPYVLFLIRPSGISAYYKALALLKGNRFDFGYELVDEDWTLDFSDQGKTPQRATSQPGTQTPSISDLAFPALPKRVGDGGPFRMGTPAGNASSPSPSAGNFGNGGKGTVNALPGRSSGGAGVPFAGSGSSRITPPSLEPPLPRTEIVQSRPSQGPTFSPIAKASPPRAIATSGQNGPPLLNPPLLPLIDSLGVKPGAPRQTGEPNGEPTGQATTPGQQGDPGFSSRPGLGQGGKNPPPSRSIGNRDFVITIACQSDAVLVTPGSMSFRWTTSDVKAIDRALAQAVGSLVERRQKSVRPGDPPYRPVIRFLVSREGLRTYYHVYPLLEPLRVPMTRENVEE